MNRELYTEEFRSYKYLKSTPEAVAFFKRQFHTVNLVQPWTKEPDPNYIWPHRVEFLEQILDLENEQLYVVRVLSPISSSERYSEPKVTEVKNPVIYCGHMLKPMLGRKLGLANIEELENIDSSHPDMEHVYYLCSSDYFAIKDTVFLDGRAGHTGIIFKVTHLPIVPLTISPSAIFYNKETAEKYVFNVMIHIQNYIDALSAIVAKS